MVNSLAQTLLKIVSPGCPDFYQGSELWDLRLVDPDNRQPVDFTLRKDLLNSVKQASGKPSTTFLEDLARNWKDARIKLYLTWKVLNFRREHADLFSKGTFMELKAAGNRNENIAAFARQCQEKWTVAVVPRWLARANYHPESSMGAGFWSNTEIRLPASSPESWNNILTGEVLSVRGARRKILRVSELLQRFPIALLSGSGTRKRSQKKRKSRKK